SDDDMG
nr:Chain B, 6-meric peptide from 60S acidic ribosomal protein P2-beta [Saccharomyces cerevisiae]3N3X_B Chain B, SDDDMG peptide [synthetic construct]